MPDEVIEKGLGRLAYQFEDSTKWRAFLESFLQEYQELSTSGLQLLNERYLNTAVGLQLDGIGDIVGVARTEELTTLVGAFGFLTDPDSRGFTDINDLDLGGNFVHLGSDTQLIGDDLYRVVIRAKIIENQTAMIVDDTTRLISFMFGGVEVRYFLIENLKPAYAIGKIISPLELFLLDHIPVLIGIEGIAYFISYDPDAFSFYGDISGLGFGDINNSALGGNFAKLIV